MPIRRRGDGEIIDESTETVQGRQAAPASQGSDESGTEPVERGGQGDSLFVGGGATERWESPTKPIGQGGDGRTRIATPGVRRPAADAVASALEEDPMSDPPVGWLVVVRGPGKGRALTLGNGMNPIGRSAESRVRLDFGDDNISRANHARLVYEPRQRRWLLSHGDGTNLTYLNGELVMATVELQSGAQIQLGETTLRFQAFCSQDFDWPDVDD